MIIAVVRLFHSPLIQTLMRLQEFITYQEKEQLQYLCFNGVCVADRETADTLILLYQLADFYVEVHHHKHSFEIVKLVSFDSDSTLDVYLEKIDVSELLDAAFH